MNTRLFPRYTPSLASAFFLLHLLAPPASHGQATPTPTPMDIALSASSVESGTLTTGSPSATRAFILDGVPRVTFSIVSSASVTVQVTTATGTVVTAANAASLNVDFVQFSLAGESQTTEFHTEVTFGRIGSPPTAGTYTVAVSSGAPPLGGVGFLISMLPESEIRVGLAMPVSESFTAQAMALTAFVFDGTAAITDATATASIRLTTGGATFNVTLLDNGTGDDSALGDGLYSGSFTPLTAGRYLVLVRVQKTTGAAADRFQRDAQFVLDVSDRTSRLNGTYAFSTPDANGDSRFEKLCIQTGLTLASAGEFLVSLTLQASNGATVNATDEVVPILRQFRGRNKLVSLRQRSCEWVLFLS